MHIVLDANIIVREGFGNNLQFRTLISTLEVSGHNLYVPKLVIEEVVAEFERVFEEGTRGFRILSRRLRITLPASVDALDKESESAQFRGRLVAQFDVPNCTILDYPETSHEELVRRATARERPFNEKGTGYRDALIWESVLELATDVDSEVVLLSNDNDFRGGGSGLHNDLVSQLDSRGLSRDRVILIRSLKNFMDTYVRPTPQQEVQPE